MRVAVDRGAAALLVAAIAIAAPPVRAAPLESPAPLERVPAHATLNTTAKGELFAWRDDECLWVAAEDLARVGVPSEGALMRDIEGRPHACLGRLEGVEAVLDEATLTIAFTVDPKRLEAQSFDLSRTEVLEITP